jgi:hypothetical protein
MPATVTVAQHIFASLTREQSPTRRRGYQTCFYTHGLLTATAVRAIEDRAQHRTTQGEKDKWQFFWLPGQQAVISHLVSVPEPDEFGRKGRYLMHSMIVSASDWRLLDCNPFVLMNPANFSRTMDRALALGDLRTGEMSAVRMEVSSGGRRERARALSDQWPTDELWKLARLTCHALAITSGGQFVAFVGDDRQINEALEVAFLLPPMPRTDCSFDTAAAGCSWPRAVTFWGQGFSEEREARTPFVVDAAQKRVRLPHDWRAPITPTEVWLKPLVSSRQFSVIQKDQGGVHLLSAVLEGRSEGRVEALGLAGSVRSSFAAANQARIEERLDSLFPAQLPDYLREKALSKIGRTPQARLDWLIMNPAGEELGDILFGIIREWAESPSPEVMQALSPLMGRHPGLRLLLALWSHEEREIQHTLSAMTAEQYRRYVQELRSRPSCSPRYFFSAKHLRDWFAIFIRQGINLGELVEGISLTAKYGGEQELEDLTAVAGLLDETERQCLLQLLEEQPFHKRVKSLKVALKQGPRANSEPASDSPTFGLGWLTRRREKH